MTVDLLRTPSHLQPAETLQISQQAPQQIKSYSAGLLSLPYPLSLLSNSESQERWQTLENLFLACLKTGDDESAYIALEKMIVRFGPGNERVQALRGLYLEATAQDEKALAEILKQYQDALKETPTNMPIRKRRIALLRSMDRTTDAITALTELLDVSPIDAEAWSELADLYLTQGQYQQAIYCLEEVLLVTPNAWNIHARLGETLVLASKAVESGSGEQLKLLSQAMRRFCRSVELCNNYLRGYYGLKLSTTSLLETLNKSSKSQSAPSSVEGDLAPPSIATVQKLSELATRKLAEIVRRGSAGEAGWDGYDKAELIAVRELLDRDSSSIAR